jgi:hypothetical protein
MPNCSTQQRKTPGQAIHAYCVSCVGSPYAVRACGGDVLIGAARGKGGVCFFYKYRLGTGRPSVKLIRRYCLECMQGSSETVRNCSSVDCPVYPYRFGRSFTRQKGNPEALRAFRERAVNQGENP